MKIPAEWHLSKADLQDTRKDVSEIPRTCGLLNERELLITGHDGTHILSQIHSGTWTAEDVCIAFCKRAAIVHQLVSR